MAAFLPAIISAAGSIGGGYLAGRGAATKESKLQKTQRKLIDQLLSSLQSGTGPYADLFSGDESAFQKSFVEPAQAMFRNQIAPQIQQQYIASGQQRGTGLDDTLTRAGVDLDSMLNQQYYQFNQDALNRKQGLINSILGSGSGAPTNPSSAQNLMSSAGGYLSSDAFKDSVTGLFKDKTTANAAQEPRKGFEE